MNEWHPICGADSLASGPKQTGWYDVTLEPKDSIDDIRQRRIAYCFWSSCKGFEAPKGFRVVAWRSSEAYDGPTPFATAQARRDFLKRCNHD